MKITISGEQHEFDLDDLTNVEAMAIERALSMSFGDFGTALSSGSASAITAVVWTILRRENSSLRFGDVSFKFSDLQFESDASNADDDNGDAPVDPTETLEASITAG